MQKDRGNNVITHSQHSLIHSILARDYMQKDRARKQHLINTLISSDEPIRLQREVVLLTDDRNLRLKAHTRNVPVRNAPAFLKWAKLG
ncbi:hypothetical protein NP493_577g02021 [Ridgeia piscesae]|uniref:PIN domain-containing protein n=1 Tax=Ridgeia piscesae TaxID=27915 RepID=A0AAD9NSI4_RIDPI|nr:hypothetical protein NP493_577g02021 [Ridgeia piscesae]